MYLTRKKINSIINYQVNYACQSLLTSVCVFFTFFLKKEDNDINLSTMPHCLTLYLHFKRGNI